MDVKITQPDAKEVHRWIFLYIDKYGSSPVYKLSMTLASTIIWEKLPTAKDLKDIKFITLNNFLNSEIIKFKQDKLILESTHGSLEPPPKNSRCIGVYNEVKNTSLPIQENCI